MIQVRNDPSLKCLCKNDPPDQPLRSIHLDRLPQAPSPEWAEGEIQTKVLIT